MVDALLSLLQSTVEPEQARTLALFLFFLPIFFFAYWAVKRGAHLTLRPIEAYSALKGLLARRGSRSAGPPVAGHCWDWRSSHRGYHRRPQRPRIFGGPRRDQRQPSDRIDRECYRVAGRAGPPAPRRTTGRVILKSTMPCVSVFSHPLIRPWRVRPCPAQPCTRTARTMHLPMPRERCECSPNKSWLPM